MNADLKTLYGLKYNPFSQDVPAEALLVTPKLDDFGWRLEHGLAQDGGFALVTGEPGCGKSTAMRLLAGRLQRLRDVVVGAIEHPGSKLGDFYREMGDLFGVPLRPNNRWAGFRSLREKWIVHIESTLKRPVLLIDEAQEMSLVVLEELRILTQTRFDSRSILGVVLAGDRRLVHRLSGEDCVPLHSRIRARLVLGAATPAELRTCLQHRMAAAGSPKLMTAELVDTLCEHALGNQRTLLQMADELLAAATMRERDVLDEKLYLEVFAPPVAPAAEPPRRAAAGRRR
jgi:type II secretory pathway predicted ATPase ExeA